MSARAHALDLLAELSKAIARAPALEAILDAALDALAGVGTERAAVLLADENGVMRFQRWRGISDAYRRAVEGHSPWPPDCRDASPIVVADVLAEPSLQVYRAAFEAEGIRALGFIPLTIGGRVIGKFMVYFGSPHAFDPDELRLVETVARQVAFAVERTRREEMLRRHEERLRLALDAGAMGTWEWDVRSNRVEWSPALERVHGLAPGSFGGTFADFQREIHPDDRERVLAAIAGALDRGEPYELEYRAITPDGRVRWLEAKGRVERDETGRPVRMLGVCADATQRKQAEAERLELAAREKAARAQAAAERTFRDLLESAPDAIIVTDESGTIRLVNSRAEALFGYTRAELLGRPVDLVLPQPAAAGAPASGSDSGGDQGPAGRRKDGSTFPAELSSSPFRAEDRHLVTIVVRDITERRRLEYERAARAEAEAANRAKDEFLAMLSHELRQPLNALTMALELAGGAPDADSRERAVQVARRQAQHLSRLVDDLLDASRIARGRIELQKAPIDLRQIIEEAAEATRSLTDERGLSLQVELPPERIWIEGDPVRLRQVFFNLISNALRYTEPGGRITVRLGRGAGETAELSVADTGHGIDPALLPRIFEPYVSGRGTVAAGLGLGLAVAKRLVELHGGQIEAASEGPGRGSTFTVRLPVTAAPLLEHTA
ncbi:MAG TPA: PAS domain S-box protein [Vicinamibacterales bacterium]|nr:PAS domain S-box protein [Vicinamibacterales bacterium]